MTRTAQKRTRIAAGGQTLARPVSQTRQPQSLSSKIRPPAAPFYLSWHRWLALAHSTSPHTDTDTHTCRQLPKHVRQPPQSRHTGCRQHTRQRGTVLVVRHSTGQHALKHSEACLPTCRKAKDAAGGRSHPHKRTRASSARPRPMHFKFIRKRS